MKYTINFGCGLAVLYTPYDCEERFYTLANTCFGIRKSIMDFIILKEEDVSCSDFERLEFNGDAYVWREDGARKMSNQIGLLTMNGTLIIVIYALRKENKYGRK